MTDDLRIPSWLRYRHPVPRDVPVTGEHHCPPGCIHLREAHRKGFEEGARAERECRDRREGGFALAVTLAFLAGMFAAAVVRVGVTWLAGR